MTINEDSKKKEDLESSLIDVILDRKNKVIGELSKVTNQIYSNGTINQINWFEKEILRKVVKDSEDYLGLIKPQERIDVPKEELEENTREQLEKPEELEYLIRPEDMNTQTYRELRCRGMTDKEIMQKTGITQKKINRYQGIIKREVRKGKKITEDVYEYWKNKGLGDKDIEIKFNGWIPRGVKENYRRKHEPHKRGRKKIFRGSRNLVALEKMDFAFFRECVRKGMSYQEIQKTYSINNNQMGGLKGRLTVEIKNRNKELTKLKKAEEKMEWDVYCEFRREEGYSHEEIVKELNDIKVPIGYKGAYARWHKKQE